MWKLLDYCRMPNTKNVYIMAMAAEWHLKRSLPLLTWEQARQDGRPQPRSEFAKPKKQRRSR